MSGVAHGTEISRRVVAGSVFVESEYSPDLQLQSHAHDRPYVGFVIEGRVAERSPRRDYLANPGTVLIRPAGLRHSDSFGPTGARILIVSVNEDSSLARHFDVVDDFESGPVVGVLASLYGELKYMDSASELVVDGLMRELAGYVKRDGVVGHDPSSYAPPPWLSVAHDRLRNEFLDPPKISTLAYEVGVHPDHLTRCFRRAYGVLPGEFIRAARLRWAAGELRSGDNLIGQIALQAGFADQSHFSREFKRFFSVPPGAYRRGA